MNDIKYLQDLRTLEGLCKTAMDLSISTYGQEVPTWREEYGSDIFGKICVTSIAILKLLPKSEFYFAPKGQEIWDISSVSVLSRSLIDSYNIFHYLIIEKVDKDELEFRFILWKLHSECERLKMLEFIKSTHTGLDKLKQYIESRRKELKDNRFYQRLDLEKQKDLIKGRKGIFLTNAKISENAGINPDYYRSVYKYLSQYIHTYPFSISQIAIFRAGDVKSLQLFVSIIGYCTGYLGLSIRDFLKVVPDQSKNITSEVTNTIQDWEYIMKFEFKD